MAEDSSSAAGSGAGGSNGGGSSTYEATMARQSTRTHPDKIHWDEGNSFRQQPYRNLHHQRGLIGVFNVRLLEASDLKRSYWSPLALGPVKHLGWSKAHGPISAYCTLGLDFSDPHYYDDYYNDENDAYASLLASNSNSSAKKSAPEKALAFHRAASSSSNSGGDGEKKPAAKEQQHQQHNNEKQNHAVSPVVHNDNNPVWENVQYEFPLVKGSMARDGMQIFLSVRVHEEATAVEHFLPGIASGGDSRLLGVGKLNVTELCLGQTTRTGQPLPGVLDAWIPITLFRKQQQQQHDDQHQQHQQEFVYDKNDPLAPPTSQQQNESDKKKEQSDNNSNSNNITGMVRVLVSYKPHGLEPQPKDVIALEAFARRNPATSTCRPLIPPLMPMTVLERRGPYLLVTYVVADSDINSSINGHHGNNNNNNGNFKACVRLHRNACFVIERQNLMDAAHNLALLPADVWMSTPVGRAVNDLTSPLVAASREVFMPAMLTFKLLWLAVRTTSLAGLSGVQALSSTFWHEGSHSLTASHHSSLDVRGVGVLGGGGGSNSGRHRSSHDRNVATAQFVQL